MADINITGSSQHSISLTGAQGPTLNLGNAGPRTSVQPSVTPNKPHQRHEPRRSYGHFIPSKIDRRMGSLLDVNNWLDSDEWVLVKSSNVAAIKYDRVHRILHVMFLGGSRYEYDMVPEMTAVSMFSAKSIGKYFHNYVKERFTVRGPFPANTRTIQTIRTSYFESQQHKGSQTHQG